MKITKVLIANRGEIACRVIRTCRALGIPTVAVYSDADARALHVELADEAVHIGAPAARESYLSVDKIIAAAKKTGANAVHPGYGFLSENEEFAQICAKNNIVFIGPPASAILAMGGKSEAKVLMEKAGVPLVPGYHGDNQDEKFLLKEAEKIGFPVLIKASAGGGGKGMRVVENAGAFAEQLAGAKREAKASFGDEKVLIEKYLVKPRHVEIQVFADKHGNCVYLFERDCSIQRRHQKVLEEAPAPGLNPDTRAKMGAAAVAAAQAIKYEGAGTVEFLLDADGRFYFMEMNTRLQVEHPVTECITGLDLVELQIRVAEGMKLPFTQKDLKINGHAIEVRLYAEDPANNFLPGAGQIEFLRYPAGMPFVRIDTGVREAAYGHGDTISIHYDPMIAKIIVWGEDRDAAIARMAQALDHTHVTGPKTNLTFLRRLVAHPAFAAADLSTAFIGKNSDGLLSPLALPDEALVLAAIGLVAAREQEIAGNDPWGDISCWRHAVSGHETFAFEEGQVTVSFARGHADMDVTVGARTFPASFMPSARDKGFDARIDGQQVHAVVVRTAEKVVVMYQGRHFDLTYIDPLAHAAEDAVAGGKLHAPMPGKVVAIHAKVGNMVKKGDALVIVEAMKMEHTITAPFDGEIETVNASVGEQVDEKRQLVAFKKAG